SVSFSCTNQTGRVIGFPVLRPMTVISISLAFLRARVNASSGIGCLPVPSIVARLSPPLGFDKIWPGLFEKEILQTVDAIVTISSREFRYSTSAWKIVARENQISAFPFTTHNRWSSSHASYRYGAKRSKCWAEVYWGYLAFRKISNLSSMKGAWKNAK